MKHMYVADTFTYWDGIAGVLLELFTLWKKSEEFRINNAIKRSEAGSRRDYFCSMSWLSRSTPPHNAVTLCVGVQFFFSSFFVRVCLSFTNA